MTYRDTSLPVASRVADLLGRMTLDEKLAQLYSCWLRDLLEDGRSLSTGKLNQWLALGIGQITRLGGSSIFNPVSSARAANVLQRYLVNRGPAWVSLPLSTRNVVPATWPLAGRFSRK